MGNTVSFWRGAKADRIDKASSRFLELDALRGIAALVVVLYHYSTQYDKVFGHIKTDYVTMFSLGHYGVQLFFIISGFVIYMSIMKVSSVKDFIIKRSFRLYPAYIFAVIITFIVVSLSTMDYLKVSLSDAMINFTMFQGFIPGVDNVDGVYWTLRVEMTFYILMGILLFMKLEKKLMFIAITWLILSSVIQTLHFFLDTNITFLLETVSISDYSQLFIIGMILFSIWKYGNNFKYFFVLFITITYDFVYQGIESGFFTLFFVIVFFLVINQKLTLLKSRIFVFLGTISYPLYLLHQFIGYVLINYMESIGLIHEFYIVIPIIISIIGAYLLYKYIEVPLQNVLYKKYNNIKNRHKVTSSTLTKV